MGHFRTSVEPLNVGRHVGKEKKGAAGWLYATLPGLTLEQNAAYNEARRRLENNDYRSGAERCTLEAEVNRLSDLSARLMESEAGSRRKLEEERKLKDEEE